MKKKVRINVLGAKVYYWRHANRKKNYSGARDIWLYCHDNNQKVPKDVLDVFVKKIREDNSKYKKKQSDKKKNQPKIKKGILLEDQYFSDGYLIYRYVNFIRHYSKGKKREDPFYFYIDAVKKKLGKENDGDYLEYDRVRKAYYRMKDIISLEGEWR
jgi:hypothetical protein